MSKVFILHENSEWLAPLRDAFDARGLAATEWHLAEGGVDLAALPPHGVFYNRMSASSHTRDHRFAPELTGSVLAWLEAHGRRVVNGGRALELELSKAKQYVALNAAGIPTPPTIVAVGQNAARDAIRTMGGPLILKPNRGGKGLGVQLFETAESADAAAAGGALDAGPDGTVLVQRYIRPAQPEILRNEFVGGKLLYTVRVDTSDGFELCPADVCNLPDGEIAPSRPKFEILDGYRHALHDRMERFLAANGIEVAGIEMIVDAQDQAWVYDINTNTNYNPDAEAAAGRADTNRSGMGALAQFLGAELEQLEVPAAAD